MEGPDFSPRPENISEAAKLKKSQEQKCCSQEAMEETYPSCRALLALSLRVTQSRAVLQLGSPEADPETRIWVLVVYLEVVQGSTGRGVGSETG